MYICVNVSNNKSAVPYLVNRLCIECSFPLAHLHTTQNTVLMFGIIYLLVLCTIHTPLFVRWPANQAHTYVCLCVLCTHLHISMFYQASVAGDCNYTWITLQICASYFIVWNERCPPLWAENIFRNIFTFRCCVSFALFVFLVVVSKHFYAALNSWNLPRCSTTIVSQQDKSASTETETSGMNLKKEFMKQFFLFMRWRNLPFTYARTE